MAHRRRPAGRWLWNFVRLRRKIWFRAALISLIGVVIAIVASLASRFLPFTITAEVGQDAVGTILEIMASSMLAVTTFSLTAMVTAYGSAAQIATPRATQLLINDTTSQTALSTFLGAFIFSIVGIIGLQTGIYGSQGRIILFAGTVLLILVVVLTLLRWIAHITAFGRLSDVIDRVEDAAQDAMRSFVENPYLGCRPEVAVPGSATIVRGLEAGYVNHIDMSRLEHLARDKSLVLHLRVYPGTMVHPSRALVAVEGPAGKECVETIRSAFTIERHRSFDNDPRLGLIALSEVGSRALAPATNDPGTAIEVLNAMLRVMLTLRDTPEPDDDEHPPIYVTAPTIEDFLDDAFGPMIREGTVELEVAIRMTKTLAALRDAVPSASAKIETLALRLREGVRRGGDDAHAVHRFDAEHDALWGPPRT